MRRSSKLGTAVLNPAGRHIDASRSDVTYEERLGQNASWALSEGSRHFEEKSAVFEALRRITARLESLEIPYAVVGGMALFRHGLRRFTEDVDILVTPEDLRVIHEKLEGLGYLPPHRHSKHLRDTELGVRIEFLTTGDYPGDGKPKPVSFPDPATVSFEAEGIRYLNLPVLVELKLASGMTNPGRLRDLSDVLELIRLLNLPLAFADGLNPWVRGKFQELWKQARKRYVIERPILSPAAADEGLAALAARLRAGDSKIDAMFRDGAELESVVNGGNAVRLVTTDPEVASKYEMVEEGEFWPGA